MFYTAISRAIALDYESTNETMDTAFRKCTYSCRFICQYLPCVTAHWGALLLEQMRHNPRHLLLSPIHKALRAISLTYDESHEQTIQRELDVCTAFTERIRWANQRDSDGLRVFSLWAMMHNSAIAIITTVEANARESVQVHLSIAIIVCNIPVIEKLLTSAVADANLESRYFGRPLHLAARYGFVEVIQTLLDHGANVEAVQHGRFQDVSGRYPSLCKGGSALETAAWAGHEDAVKLLLKRDTQTPARLVVSVVGRRVRSFCSNIVVRLPRPSRVCRLHMFCFLIHQEKHTVKR